MTVLDYSNPNGLRRALTGWCRKWSGSAYTPPERGAATRAMGAAAVVSMLTAILLATPATAQAQNGLVLEGGISTLALTRPESTENTAALNVSIGVGRTGEAATEDLTWSLGGVDSRHFAISRRGFSVLARSAFSPDFELPLDAGRNNVYNFFVRVAHDTLALVTN